MNENQIEPGMLQRVAEALGLTTEELRRSSAASPPIGDTHELLQLWLAIRDDGSRRRLLALARELQASSNITLPR